jgi:hypothetical protein
MLTPFFFATTVQKSSSFQTTTTRIMKRSLISFFSLLAVATAQSPSDFELIYPGDGINFEACYKDLDAADNIVRDGGVRQDEFLGFIQRYAERKCLTNNVMSLRQFAAFNALSCVCASLEGQDESCCLGDNGQVDTGGALTRGSRTLPQIQFLIYTCITVDNTLPETACIRPFPPSGIAPQAELGGVIGTPNVPVYTKQVEEEEDDDDDDNVWDWLKWVLIALGILLLLLCCCCCTIRRKRLLAIAEEEEEQRLAAAAAEKKMDVEQAPEPEPELTEQYPSDDGDAGEQDIVYTEGEEDFVVEVAEESESAPDEEMAVASAAAAGMNDDDDDDDEDGNRRTGAHNLPADDDEEKRRIAGYGQLPPDEDPDNRGLQLRPVPPREKEEDPDWDHPGRDINFPKPEPDEYSAGEFDHYDPDGGYISPDRERKEPTEYAKPHWERLKKETPEEVDMRKRRIQSGLGEAEVWNILEDHDDHEENNMPSGDVFDWVVESALGVLDKSDDVVHLKDEDQES